MMVVWKVVLMAYKTAGEMDDGKVAWKVESTVAKWVGQMVVQKAA